jgi:Helitron helicase-like domain at N-terminus
MCSNKNVSLTQMDYYAYRLHIKMNESGVLHRACCLFQEFIVDAYAQIENARLLWFRLNQSGIHAEEYTCLINAVANGEDLNNVGRRVILPSSFIGGPRQMSQLYHDAMAIVRNCGKPDLFITMTCNPRWPEIRDALLPNQTAKDRADIVARVFKLKLDAMCHDLFKCHVFGRVVGRVHVIEFQKRGLPHAHILVILHPDDKPRTNSQIDQIVCAEIPDKDQYPELFATVTSNMFHGPCGKFKPDAPSMENGKCTKRYPRHYLD